MKDGAMKTSELQRRIPGLKRAVGKYKNLTDTNWLTKVYKDKFVVEDGVVKLKRLGSAPASSSGVSKTFTPNTEALPVSREGGSSSSRALPANYSVPALTFRGVVEQPGKRAAQQEAKRLAEALKEEQKKAKRDAQAQRWIEQETKRVDRYVKQALRWFYKWAKGLRL